MLRRLFSKHGTRWTLGLVLTVLACAQTLGMFPATLTDRIDLFFYDMRIRVQPAAPDPRIVIVDIDDKSIAEVGRWPWSRNVIADFVTKLADHYHARTIAFDVLFSEADTSSGYGVLEGLAKGELKEFAAFGERLKTLKASLDYDGRLAAALHERPVVLSYFLSNRAHKGLLPAPAFTASELNGNALDVLPWKGYEGALPALQRTAKAGGYMNTEIDPDGLLRSIPLVAQIDNSYYESLALATARVALGATAIRPVFLSDDVRSDQAQREYGVLESLRLNTLPRQTVIPVEREIKALIQYRGRGGPDGGTFRYIAAADVLKGRVPLQDLENKIVLVGTTAAGLKDLRATPVNSEYPGVEAHANMVASILDGDFKQRPDFAAAIDLLQVIALGVTLTVALSLLTPVWSILFSLTMAAAIGAFNFWMYQAHDMVLPVANALLLIAGLFVVNIAWGYLFEHRKGRAMVNLFGEYVAPELVAEMAANPNSYSMEGESRELTVLFADVRGFTTISEGLDPNTLREYINIYLTAMSENIRGNRGTLDKYIGDAVMAFWGAPVTLPDHAARAVATALQMQATAASLNRDFLARGWPALRIGIGLNTGEMRVGDMGSKIRRAYTVMGDAVNLSSRLEGITKVYGVGITVGEGTMRAAPDFAYRELDRVKVKGKNEPVPIFEPIALKTQLDAGVRDNLEKWHEALALIRAQRWDEAESRVRALHDSAPDDGLYLLYLERIAHYREHPPGTDWDGVTTFETK
ncbi:adenylate/guanylate cyclase domain-containing protein [Noviherbaspirillum cavernae]|uniref:Adenylate/guanylate cyclase domain-containing protein n=1 Tax=Noviherbaspirillum cavernae TaxID=2320862 RepID=A0A418X6T1_9BURK|nr:adenylate/guanylate cyclase domain-containing protein [Noviherbaspirillum cavernae]RJG08051.1 adenylate/guanylate cyclase domain-containing protein [Noviherbaspirillum cavernae]